MIWTPETIEALRNLWLCGVSTIQIGKTLGASKNSVIGKAHRLGLPERPSPIGVTGPRSQRPQRPTQDKPVRSGSISARQANSMRFRKDPTLPPLPPLVEPHAARVPVAAPTPAPVPAPVMFRRSAECQWPVSERPWRFCEAPTDGRPYCEEHARRVYVPHREPVDAD